MSKLLTIMVTMYNSETSVFRTLNSIIPQLTSETELVIVDDGSKDKSFELAKEITKNLDNCKIIKQNNQGSIVARKTGFDASTSCYCWAIDCGDTISTNSINVILNEIKCNPHDVYIFNFNTIDGEKISTSDLCITKEPIKDLLLGRILPSLWTKVIKRTLLYKLYDDEIKKIRFVTDLYVSCDALSQTNDVSFIKEPLYNYIVEPNSMITSGKNDLGAIHSIEMSKRAIEKNIDYEFFKEEFEYFVFNQYIINFIFMRKNKKNIDIFYNEYRKYNINTRKNKYIGKKALVTMLIPLEKILPFKDSLIKKVLS